MQQKRGANLSQVTTTQEFDLGTRSWDPDNQAQYIYLKNYTTGALTAYLAYSYDPDTYIISDAVETVMAASGEAHKIVVPQVAVSQGTSSVSYFFWAFCGPGKATFTSVAAITAQAKIYTSATEGKIDDDASGEILIPGLVAYDAFASAVTGVCHASHELYISN